MMARLAGAGRRLVTWVRGFADPRAHQEAALPPGGALLGDVTEVGESIDVGPGDHLGPYPADRASGDATRPWKRGLMVSVAVNILQVLTGLLQISAIDMLIPLQKPMPYFIRTWDGEKSVVEVWAPGTRADREDVMDEGEVARYVQVRFEIAPDMLEMKRRWGSSCFETVKEAGFEARDQLCSYVLTHSTLPVWQKSRAAWAKAEEYIKEGKARNVRVLSDPVRKAGREWEVRFETVDYWAKDGKGTLYPDEKQVIERRIWRATLWLAPRDAEAPAKMERRHRQLNPRNFRVVDFYIGEDKGK